MVAFRADLDSMVALASRLRSVSAALSQEDSSSVDSSVCGAGEAAAALDGFVANWSHGRAEIISGIKTVHDALVGASGNYRATDQAMAARL